MALVRITRRLEWFGLTRRIMIEVDGQEVGGVRVRGVLPLELSPGVHAFRASMAWVGSELLEVEVSEGGTTMIGVGAPFRRAKLATGASFPASGDKQDARETTGSTSGSTRPPLLAPPAR